MVVIANQPTLIIRRFAEVSFTNLYNLFEHNFRIKPEKTHVMRRATLRIPNDDVVLHSNANSTQRPANQPTGNSIVEIDSIRHLIFIYELQLPNQLAPTVS